MTIVTTYDAVQTAIDNLQTDIAAADGSTATNLATKDLATRLAADLEAVLVNGVRVRERAATAGQ